MSSELVGHRIGPAAPTAAVTPAAEAGSFTVFSGREGLAALRGPWEEIAADAPPLAFYQQHRWYEAYLRHLAPDPAAMHFFLLEGNGRPLAIVPLRRSGGRWRPRVFELPVHPHVSLGDAVIRSGTDPAAVVRALYRDLRRRGGWDVLAFMQLLDTSALAGGLRAARIRPTTRTYSRQSNSIPAAGGYEAVAARLSRTFRRNLRRLAKRCEAAGSLTYRSVREPDALDAALERFLEVEGSGWKGGRGAATAIRCTPSLTAFYRELAQRFGVTRDCVINLLELDGQCLAAEFCLLSAGVLNLLKIGYRESHASLGPGTVLVDRVLADWTGRPETASVSFVTDTAWQKPWHPDGVGVYHHRIYRCTPRGLGVLLYYAGRPRLARWVRALRGLRRSHAGVRTGE